MVYCFREHRNVAGTVKCIQISMGLINFLLLILGCVITGLGSWYFMQFNDVLTAMPDIRNGEYVTTSQAMTPFYSILVLGVFMTIVAFSGCFGAVYLDRCCITGYIIMLSLLLCTFIGGFVASIYVKDDFNQALDSLFSTYEQNMYGLSGSKKVIMYPLDRLIEKMHRSHTCCGFFNPFDNITAAQMAVLYWSENTHWGQVNALQFNFDLNAKFDWLPESCCKSNDKCELNTFEHSDRLDWNNSLESFWTDQINTASCKGKTLDFASVAAGQKGAYYAFVACTILLVIVLLIMAIILHIETGRIREPQSSELVKVKPKQNRDDDSVKSESSTKGMDTISHGAPQPFPGLYYPGNQSNMPQPVSPEHLQYNNQAINGAPPMPLQPVPSGYPQYSNQTVNDAPPMPPQPVSSGYPQYNNQPINGAPPMHPQPISAAPPMPPQPVSSGYPQYSNQPINGAPPMPPQPISDAPPMPPQPVSPGYPQYSNQPIYGGPPPPLEQPLPYPATAPGRSFSQKAYPLGMGPRLVLNRQPSTDSDSKSHSSEAHNQ